MRENHVEIASPVRVDEVTAQEDGKVTPTCDSNDLVQKRPLGERNNSQVGLPRGYQAAGSRKEGSDSIFLDRLGHFVAAAVDPERLYSVQKNRGDSQRK